MITPMAMPRSAHSVTVLFAATKMFDAKTMQPEAVASIRLCLFSLAVQRLILPVKPRAIAWTAKTVVINIFGRRYAASRYTFSPPLRGIMQANSSQTQSPDTDSRSPSTHRSIEAPKDPTPLTIEEGVEKIPVPIIRPILKSRR